VTEEHNLHGVDMMLEYREFPMRTALNYILFAPAVAFSVFIITSLLNSNLFLMTETEHFGLLGFGALAATLSLPAAGLLVDRIRHNEILMIIAALIPSTMGIWTTLSNVSGISLLNFELIVVVITFSCLTFLLVSWTVRMSQTIVMRFRGRASAVFLSAIVSTSIVYSLVAETSLVLFENKFMIASVVTVASIFLVIGLKPWKHEIAPLAARGSVTRYFIPLTLILAAYMLWSFVTKLSFQSNGYPPLSEYLNAGIYESAILIVGIAVAGSIADFRGRKSAFGSVVLLMGLLTIFGSAMYDSFFDISAEWLIWLLLTFERFIEGYLLGLCLLLIWVELGSAKTKGLRVSLVWFFFLGFMTLYWAVDLQATVFGLTFSIPTILVNFGGNIAVFLSLVSLYLIGSTPEILGREMEMEELDLDFDERQVKRTVAAFVESEDFDSIRTQLDVIDATADISDKDMHEILGDDFLDTLPLKRVPGIGPSLEKKLKKAGYESAAQLAGEAPKRLAEKVEGLGHARAEKIINDARRVVKKTVKTKRKRNS
jgi:predicted flap endonuclease-1-like 5' DNA nuclease